MRPYLPLLQLLEGDVPSTQNASAVVYDIPVNLLRTGASGANEAKISRQQPRPLQKARAGHSSTFHAEDALHLSLKFGRLQARNEPLGNVASSPLFVGAARLLQKITVALGICMYVHFNNRPKEPSSRSAAVASFPIAMSFRTAAVATEGSRTSPLQHSARFDITSQSCSADSSSCSVG